MRQEVTNPIQHQQLLKKEKRRLYYKKIFELYLMLSIPLIFLIIFAYGPMGGLIIAFKNFRPVRGFIGSAWTADYGLRHFIRFFKNPQFWPVIRNTLVLSLYGIAVKFPCAIALAIGLNYVKNKFFQRVVQSVAYFPYFISVIVMVSIMNMIFDPRVGVAGQFLFNATGISVLSHSSTFPSLYVWSGIWQMVGYNAIVYIAALSAVDNSIHEAATIDGANIWQRIRYVDLVTIIPTVVIMLILEMGRILGVGYEKAYAMQYPGNLPTSEIISTFAYKMGIFSELPDYSYGAAVGLFQSFVGLILIVLVNKISKKLSGSGLW